MTETMHPLAPHHLPSFITPPGSTDTLLVAMVIALIGVIVAIGTLYLRLHSLPEHMAHKVNSTQLQLIGVLCLLALFTHNWIFWVLALLLASVNPPDFVGPLNSIARSLDRMSGSDPATDPDILEPLEPKTAAPEAPAESGPATDTDKHDA